MGNPCALMPYCICPALCHRVARAAALSRCQAEVSPVPRQQAAAATRQMSCTALRVSEPSPLGASQSGLLSTFLGQGIHAHTRMRDAHFYAAVAGTCRFVGIVCHGATGAIADGRNAVGADAAPY